MPPPDCGVIVIAAVVVSTRAERTPSHRQGGAGYGPAPADWFPDRSGRHELRYFDDTAWTANVSTRGVESVEG